MTKRHEQSGDPLVRRAIVFSNSPRLLASGLVLAGLILGCLAAPASAARLRGPKREPQQLSNAQLREAHQVLQATKVMLESADHDYGGHRVQAIKAVSAAEQQLRLALESQNRGRKAVGKPAG